jgi:hypothetical protein
MEENINAWADKLRSIDPILADQIDEPRSLGLENLEKNDLPRYKNIQMPLADFISNPEKYCNNLKTSLFWAILQPTDPTKPRYSIAIGKSKEEIMSYIAKNINKKDENNYEIILSEYLENSYGGNMIVNGDGKLVIELVSGRENHLDKGKQIPEFIVERDPFTNSFKYSFEDVELRSAIQEMLQSIVEEGNGREKKFKPGYYEIVFARENKDSKLIPKFIDYKDNPAYELKQQV